MSGRALPLPVYLFAGFLVWSSSFVVLYALNATGCGLGWNEAALGPLTLLRAVLIGAWVLHLAAFVPLVAALRSRTGAGRPKRGIALSAWGSTLAALVATVWTGIPVLLATNCS